MLYTTCCAAAAAAIYLVVFVVVMKQQALGRFLLSATSSPISRMPVIPRILLQDSDISRL